MPCGGDSESPLRELLRVNRELGMRQHLLPAQTDPLSCMNQTRVAQQPHNDSTATRGHDAVAKPTSYRNPREGARHASLLDLEVEYLLFCGVADLEVDGDDQLCRPVPIVDAGLRAVEQLSQRWRR